MKKTIWITIMTIIISSLEVTSQHTITLKPNADSGKDAILHSLSSESDINFGDNAQLPSSAWTFSGTPAVVRGIIEFDLSAIGNGAVIDNAYLSLYAWGSMNGFGQHSTLNGSNESWLQRITSTWDESTVTWNTQPTSTTQNQVSIPQSNGPSDDYLNIDVTSLVQDMIDNPSTSFGFLLRLQNEEHYRQLNFASSDHDNYELRPKLVINFTGTLSVTNENSPHNFKFQLIPNPTSDQVLLDFNHSLASPISYHIFNAMGQIIEHKEDIYSDTIINVSTYANGIYFVHIRSSEKVFTKKLIIK